MILRELLAVFGLSYDERGQQQAEKGLDKLKVQADDLANVFGQILAAGAIGAPFVLLAEMASDAQENLNLLELAFGENSDAIVDWSNEAGPAMGRSRFTLRELAAEFGGLLQPMLGTTEALSDMSKGLSQMAVDLSSARNIEENEALRALQSGLSGNILSMRRFGVDLRAARVESEALAQGINKSTQEMTQGELASIRYSIIMQDLAFIQGDAAATQDLYANSTRAMRDALKDIGTELGFFLLPAFEENLATTRDMLVPLASMAQLFRAWAEDTNLAKAALLGLSVAMGAILLPLLLKIVPLLLGFAAFVIIMDDVITAFQGGNSVLLLFAESMDELEKAGFPGFGTAAKIAMTVLNRFRDVIGAVMAVLFALFEGLTTGNFKLFTDTINTVRESFDNWLEGLGAWGKGIKAFLSVLVNQFVALGGIISAVIQAVSTGSLSPLKGAVEGLKGLFNDTKGDVNAVFGGSAQTFVNGGGTAATGGPRASPSPGLAGGRVSVTEGDKTYNMNIQQEPGENSEDFANRVVEIIGDQEAQRNEALFTELVPVGGT